MGFLCCRFIGFHCWKSGYRGWITFVCILICGAFMYVLPYFAFLRSGSQAIATKLALAAMEVPTPHRDDCCKKSQPQAPVNVSAFYSLAPHLDDKSYAYDNNWVGFTNFSNVNCQAALNYPTLNRNYPIKASRRFPAEFLEDARDCKFFIHKHGFLRYPNVTQEELEFPIAYSLLFHKDLDQVIFLLRAIYHPHNVYCLSVDTKVPVEFLEAVRSIAQCLPNVFVSSKLENVVYSGFSRLMADVHCFEDLVNHSVPWKYVINGPGQAFPLRTNLEIVQILKLFNGTNDIEAKTGSQRLEDRYSTKWEYFTNRTSGKITLKQTKIQYIPPPHGLEIVKCSAYGAFTRNYVRFILTNQIAKALLEWTKPVFSPDELFWATLNYNKIVQAPGGFKGVTRKKPWLTSFSVWKKDKYVTCLSKFVRDICIFSPADLPNLIKQHSLFANKFYITDHPAALHCLDQLIYNVTFSNTVRGIKFYQSQDLASRGGVEQ